MAERLLTAKGVENIEKIRVDLDPQQRAEMMEKTGRRTVPQIRRFTSATRMLAALTIFPRSTGKASSTACCRAPERLRRSTLIHKP